MKQKNKARSDAFGGCHPIVNFLYFLFVLGITMFVQHPLILMISFAGALVYAVRLQGAGHVGKNLLMVTLPGLLIITLLNPFLNHYGVTKLLYLEASGNWVTLEALVYGFVLGSVLFIIFTWFSCYNIIMTSDKFIYLFGRLIPAASLILSMVLRFVPRYQRQLEIIRNGQKCAGHDISNAGLINKIKYGMAMLSILVTWALENAIETADSMKSRGYGLPGRSAFSNYTFTEEIRFHFCSWEDAELCFLQVPPRDRRSPSIIQGFLLQDFKLWDTAQSLAVLSGWRCFLTLPLLFSAFFHLFLDGYRICI